jgi:pimeloyl-ACP methyl ester carboxylesterase
VGLALLFFVGGFLAAVIFLLGIVHDARFPSRATMGWALGRGIPVDPSAMGLQSTEVKWRNDQLAWRIPGGDVNGVITIIIHGWRRSRIDSLRRLDPWLKASSEVWLIDLDGHGESPAGPTTLGAADAPAIVAFIHDLLAGAANESQISKRILLVGHSLGASIALRVAPLLPATSLAGVVAFAPFESLKIPLGNQLKARALPVFPFAKASEIYLHVINGKESSTTAALKQIHKQNVPVLIVGAQLDQTVSLDHVRRMVDQAGVALTNDPDSAHDDLGTQLNGNLNCVTSQAAVKFLQSIGCAAV